MHTLKLAYFFTLLIILTTCKSLRTAPFDHYSYQKNIEIKIDASRLIDKATSSYKKHSAEAEHLNREIEKMLEYEKHKPNNDISHKMWQIISNRDANLLTGFLHYWKNKDSLSPYFVIEAKAQITNALDLLIQYEGKKDPKVKNQLLEFISTY